MSQATNIQRSITKIGELRPLQLVDSQHENHSTDPTTSRSKSPKAVLKRRFPISNNKPSFEAKAHPEKRLKPTYSTVTRLKSTPKATYHEFLALDQAGEAHIANDNAASCNLVAIKTFEWSRGTEVDCYEELRHDNIVNMIDIFVKDRQICMVYEQMDVSLRLINGLPGGEWEPFEIAAICKEILGGLTFIHEELHSYHGSISCGTILLSRDGYIKIANVGDCVIRESSFNDEMVRDDIRCIGYTMLEMMEQDTSIRRPRQIQLARPDVWKDESGIKQFLDATQTQSLVDLRIHFFLPEESNRAHLKPHVFTALIAAKTNWDIIAPRRLPSRQQSVA